MKKIIDMFWNVFGYAFVGYISLIYGIVLQGHNYEMNFKEVYWENNEFKGFYVVIMIIMILLNLLFAHAYATLYLDVKDKEEETKISIYTTLGHWIETVIVIVVIAYLVPIIILCNKSFYLLTMVLVLSVHWGVCIGYYRTFLYVNKCKYKDEEKHSQVYDSIKYKLIIPAMLMIASNIYAASCIREMWDGKLEYLGLMVILSVFILGYTVYDFIEYRFFGGKKRNNTKEMNQEGLQVKTLELTSMKHELMPVFVFFALLLGTEGINLYVIRYEGIYLLDTPMRSFFLASFVAVYLAMFEGWFVIKGINDISDTVIRYGVDFILVYMPAVVCCLFPFQDFEIAYFLFFLIGHNFARWYWIRTQISTDENYKNLAFMRAILGTLTLIALIIDKKYPIKVDEVLKNLINTKTIGDATLALTFVEMLLCVVPLRRVSLKKIRNSVLIYFLTVIFLAVVMYVGKSAPTERIFLSIMGMLVFSIFECYIFNNNLEKEGEEKGEAK